MRCKLTEVPPNFTTEMFMMVALRRWANAQRSNSPSRDRWKVLTRREDEPPTQSQISTSILKYTTIDRRTCAGAGEEYREAPRAPLSHLGGPPRALRGGISKSIFQRGCQYLAINAHEMAPRTTQWFQERHWNAPTKGLLWFRVQGAGCRVQGAGCTPASERTGNNSKAFT